MLRWRLAGAAGLIIPMLGVIWLEDHANFGKPGLYLLPVAILFAVLGIGEFLLLIKAGGLCPAPFSVHLSALLVLTACVVPTWSRAVIGTGDEAWLWFAIAISASMASISIAEMWRYREPGRSVINMAGGVLSFLYVSLPICFLLQIRAHVPGRLALVAIVSVLFVVKWSDAGAYFAGRLWGRHQLAPVLSPKKTVEGAIGGVIVAILASWLYFRVIATLWMEDQDQIGFWMAVAGYGLTLALAGIIGDLSESLVKRDMQRKDASSWIPGLGGTLDVVDSLLWTSPLAYVWWTWGAFKSFPG